MILNHMILYSTAELSNKLALGLQVYTVFLSFYILSNNQLSRTLEESSRFSFTFILLLVAICNSVILLRFSEHTLVIEC